MSKALSRAALTALMVVTVLPLQAPPAAAAEKLIGLFEITAGQCEASPLPLPIPIPGGLPPTGSWFRMIQSGGTAEAGPYVTNTDSPCQDKGYTPMNPGSDGGLLTTGFQKNPNPAFSGGNGLAKRITKPVRFFGVDFATSTNRKDPQTGTKVKKPKIVHDGTGVLSGDLRAFSAAWSGQHFNQGSPKPDKEKPGLTDGPTGSYDPVLGTFTLEWRSTIVGGAFNGFTGVWHLEGTFVPKEQAGTAIPQGASRSGSLGVLLPDRLNLLGR